MHAVFHVPLRQAKIYYLDFMRALAYSNKEVVRLYISMQEVALMYVLNALEHLVRKH
jgi:hypothetical protein